MALKRGVPKDVGVLPMRVPGPSLHRWARRRGRRDGRRLGRDGWNEGPTPALSEQAAEVALTSADIRVRHLAGRVPLDQRLAHAEVAVQDALDRCHRLQQQWQAAQQAVDTAGEPQRASDPAANARRRAGQLHGELTVAVAKLAQARVELGQLREQLSRLEQADEARIQAQQALGAAVDHVYQAGYLHAATGGWRNHWRRWRGQPTPPPMAPPRSAPLPTPGRLTDLRDGSGAGDDTRASGGGDSAGKGRHRAAEPPGTTRDRRNGHGGYHFGEEEGR